jgi:hypothetical protein
MEFKEALKSFGFVNISDTVPWRDIFPKWKTAKILAKVLSVNYRVFL